MHGELEKLIAALKEALVDAEKADKGNKAAGVRFRKATVAAEKSLKDLRKKSLESGESDE